MDMDASRCALKKRETACHADRGMARQIIQARLSTTSSGPLFKTETGTPLGSHHLGCYLLNRRRRLPIEKFTTHDLRRTVVTMLAKRASRWILLRRSLATRQVEGRLERWFVTTSAPT